MLENYRSGLVWETMKKNPHIRRGLERAGFTGGWLDDAEAAERIDGARSPLAAPRWLSTAARQRAGCGAQVDRALELWAMGREGEVVPQLIPEFEAANPGVRVKVQQLPWTAAHEKLLTAFAGDATPDLCALGNTWVPEFVALGALEDLASRIAASAVVAPADYFSGAWETNAFPAGHFGVPWYVDTRLLFYRRDLLARAGFPEPPETWAEWRRALAAIKEMVGPGQYSILLPLNEFEPLLVLALQQPTPLLRDGGRYGNFESADFLARFRLLRRDVPARLGAEGHQHRDLERVAGVRARLLHLLHHRPVEHRRVQAPPAGRAPGLVDDGAHARARADRAPRSPAAPAWCSSAAPGTRHAAWKLIEYLSRPESQVRFHALTGNLPPRRTAWEDPAAQRTTSTRRPSASSSSAWRRRRKVPEWERIAQQMRLVSEAAVEGKMTVAEAARALDRDVDRMLEKRRWLLARGAALGGSEEAP